MQGAELSERLPEPIFQLVESFKKFVREQKTYRDQRFEVDPIQEVGRAIEEFTSMFQRISFESDRHAKVVNQIKDDTIVLLRHAERAYSQLRSHPTNNPSIQPQSSQYFAETADQFEARMKAYGDKIKELKNSLDNITRTCNVDDLFRWLKRQHEALAEIAAKIYITHERIMEKKSEFDKSIVTSNIA
ncbi:uncharacterized protein LOC126804763 [Argentina anserina]|uniref:uncharacterized protein LOC126804763 n=1 Tax=Argentina anserina TaxID=57926 RepID=UPI002176525B|nr:uncharacterized protein LOC126804763 [Potentilla anserina]